MSGHRLKKEKLTPKENDESNKEISKSFSPASAAKKKRYHTNFIKNRMEQIYAKNE